MENLICCGDFGEMIFDFIFLYYYFLAIFPNYPLIERYIIRFKDFFRISDLIYSDLFW
jgi:hypothetical protein